MTETNSKNPGELDVAIYVPEKKRPLVGLGVFLTMVTPFLAGNSLSAIMPNIVADIGGMELFAAVFAVGTIFQAIFSSIAGKLGELQGVVKMFIIGSICSFILTAAIGLIPGMVFLVVLRALTGITNALVTCMGLVIIGMIFPSSTRTKWMGFFGTMNAATEMLAPVVSGIFSDTIGWRYFFFFCVPFGVIGLLLVMKFMPKAGQKGGAGGKFDMVGTVLFACVLLGVLLLCQGGGVYFPWASIQTALIAAVIAVLIFLFVRVESKAGNTALLPMTLFKKPVFSFTILGNVFATMSTMAIYVYMVLYVQQITGLSNTVVAAAITVKSVTALFGSTLFGIVVSKFGSKIIKPVTIGALALSVVSNLGLAFMVTPSTNIMFVYALMVVFGIGCSVTTTVFTMIVQLKLSGEELSIGTSVMQTGQVIGASIASAVFGAVAALSIQSCFIVAAVLAVIAAACVLFINMKQSVPKAA